jgi:LmbE family N-acetylglucosaminyl deacetylase
MFVVQPHFDDAVLGIGLTMLQHARSGGDGFTLTVFGGRPREYRPLSERPHDDRCGFSPTDDPVGVRRAEERAAWALLGDRWTGRWLPWLDAQYLWPEHHDPFDDAHDIAVEILAAWEKAGKPPTIWTVAGIAHEDHVLCRDAVLAVARAADVDVNVWLEPGYRTTFNSSEALASITRSTGSRLELALLDRERRDGEAPVRRNVPVAARRAHRPDDRRRACSGDVGRVVAVGVAVAVALVVLIGSTIAALVHLWGTRNEDR